jgi:hypothetical protein
LHLVLQCSTISPMFFVMYNEQHSGADGAPKKSARALERNPRRRDVAPTGELAGLPARDAPKSF